MRRPYGPWLTIATNAKMGGILIDLDTVKGCTEGIAENRKGCYGVCYAARLANRRGINFAQSVVRRFENDKHEARIIKLIKDYDVALVRIGTSGDPSHDWAHTVDVCERIAKAGKPLVIITKHWHEATNEQLGRLSALKAIVNTSTSPLDRPDLRRHRVKQYMRFAGLGGRSVLRVVTVNPADTDLGRGLKRIQETC